LRVYLEARKPVPVRFLIAVSQQHRAELSRGADRAYCRYY